MGIAGYYIYDVVYLLVQGEKEILAWQRRNIFFLLILIGLVGHCILLGVEMYVPS